MNKYHLARIQRNSSTTKYKTFMMATRNKLMNLGEKIKYLLIEKPYTSLHAVKMIDESMVSFTEIESTVNKGLNMAKMNKDKKTINEMKSINNFISNLKSQTNKSKTKYLKYLSIEKKFNEHNEKYIHLKEKVNKLIDKTNEIKKLKKENEDKKQELSLQEKIIESPKNHKTIESSIREKKNIKIKKNVFIQKKTQLDKDIVVDITNQCMKSAYEVNKEYIADINKETSPVLYCVRNIFDIHKPNCPDGYTNDGFFTFSCVKSEINNKLRDNITRSIVSNCPYGYLDKGIFCFNEETYRIEIKTIIPTGSDEISFTNQDVHCPKNYTKLDDIGLCVPDCKQLNFELRSYGPICAYNLMTLSVELVSRIIDLLYGIVELVAFVLSLGSSTAATPATNLVKNILKKTLKTVPMNETKKHILKFVKNKIKEKLLDTLKDKIINGLVNVACKQSTEILLKKTKEEYEKKVSESNESDKNTDKILEIGKQLFETIGIGEIKSNCIDQFSAAECVKSSLDLISNFDPTGIASIYSAFVTPICEFKDIDAPSDNKIVNCSNEVNNDDFMNIYKGKVIQIRHLHNNEDELQSKCLTIDKSTVKLSNCEDKNPSQYFKLIYDSCSKTPQIQSISGAFVGFDEKENSFVTKLLENDTNEEKLSMKYNLKKLNTNENKFQNIQIFSPVNKYIMEIKNDILTYSENNSSLDTIFRLEIVKLNYFEKLYGFKEDEYFRLIDTLSNYTILSQFTPGNNSFFKLKSNYMDFEKIKSYNSLFAFKFVSSPIGGYYLKNYSGHFYLTNDKINNKAILSQLNPDTKTQLHYILPITENEFLIQNANNKKCLGAVDFKKNLDMEYIDCYNKDYSLKYKFEKLDVKPFYKPNVGYYLKSKNLNKYINYQSSSSYLEMTSSKSSKWTFKPTNNNYYRIDDVNNHESIYSYIYDKEKFEIYGMSAGYTISAYPYDDDNNLFSIAEFNNEGKMYITIWKEIIDTRENTKKISNFCMFGKENGYIGFRQNYNEDCLFIIESE